MRDQRLLTIAKRAIGLLLLPQMVCAATPQIPAGAIFPEQTSKALQEQQPVAAPQALPAIVSEKKQAPSPLGEQAKKIKFQLNGIVLEGNRRYSTQTLEPIYKKKLHKVITVAELFEIVQDITNYYRNNGYILSRAILPPQHVKGGIVHVKVIEGYIGKATVSGNPRGARCRVLAFGKIIAECRPLEIKRMEKYLLLANEIPGTDVKAVLAPSKTQVGAADLTLVTQTKAATAYVSYDNYGTRFIGPQQMTANVAVNSIAIPGDSGQTTFTKTPRGGELTYNDINYNFPVTDEGSRLLLGGTRTHTHPLFILAPAQVDGVSDNYYSMFQFPMIRTRSENLTLRTGFNYLDSTVVAIQDIQLYTDHIRSFDAGGTWNFTDRWYGANTISGDFRQGLPILGYTSNTDPFTAQTSHPGGRGDYTKIVLNLNRLQAIVGPLTLFGVFQGQWAFNPLLASEQFTFGGSQLGRGYDVAEIIGDKGVAGSLELRYDQAIGTIIQTMQFYTFYDAGMIWNFKFVGGIPRKLSATSFGFGSRFFFTKYISGNVMWAQPLTKPVLAEQETCQRVVNGIVENCGNGNAPRVFFSVVMSLG